jgi:hypothetical protein
MKCGPSSFMHTSMHAFVCPLPSTFLSAYYLSGTVIGVGDPVVGKTDIVSVLELV